jgi:hypothetical protein
MQTHILERRVVFIVLGSPVLNGIFEVETDVGVHSDLHGNVREEALCSGDEQESR